jgi:hypothetical protein
VRFRPIHLLASATLLGLWGCPVGNAPSSGDESASGADSAGAGTSVGFGNTAAHADAVDSVSDVAWVEQVQVAPGSAAVRVLMTDAPVDADNVFVTFCGVRVATRDGSSAAQAGAGGQARASADAGVLHEDVEVESADDTQPSKPDGANGDGGVANAERDGADAGVPAADAPAPDAGARSGWISISDECQTLDLLTLQSGVTEDIGINALPAGSYGQIRLMLREASIVKGGITQKLTVPSGTESGVKIIGGFTVVAGQPTTITIDFDAASSIHYAPGQGFIMNPVIKVVDVVKHGDGAGGDTRSADDSPSTRDAEQGQGSAGATDGAAGGRATEPGAGQPAGTGGTGASAGEHGAGAGGSGEAGHASGSGEAGHAGAGGSAQY